MTEHCPACGAPWSEGQTCTDHFHQMLYWEAEKPALGAVHHLMVLCYHLQHPHLYSPEGLQTGKQLLVDFLEQELSPEQVRRQNRARVASNQRQWKITGTPTQHGSYSTPVPWTMTAAEVVAQGKAGYIASVEAWAQSVHAALTAAGQLIEFIELGH